VWLVYSISTSRYNEGPWDDPDVTRKIWGDYYHVFGGWGFNGIGIDPMGGVSTSLKWGTEEMKITTENGSGDQLVVTQDEADWRPS